MSRYQLTKSVVLVGMMGAGKTAVGKELARLIGAEFVDSDDAIETAANATIAEIFSQSGEAFFREKESQVLARLLNGPPIILSTGGGAYLSHHNRRLIDQRAMAVWLRADLDLLWSRVRRKETRPLLRVPDPRARLGELLVAREPAYGRAALVIRTDDNYSVPDMAALVLDKLISHPGAPIRKVA
ncbi:MAG: shikimate kinase [Paracoccaceae bacterium]